MYQKRNSLLLPGAPIMSDMKGDAFELHRK
jgi:hypothetical protein